MKKTSELLVITTYNSSSQGDFIALGQIRIRFFSEFGSGQNTEELAFILNRGCPGKKLFTEICYSSCQLVETVFLSEAKFYAL
jgi:hypothetical protein